ncbi:hypothetical protein, partial [Acinetobacter pittii]|uniref:hypothetical protein n=1 Tax=Acinetobacter pittii TaxID=48296 RepID=UPI001BB43727
LVILLILLISNGKTKVSIENNINNSENLSPKVALKLNVICNAHPILLNNTINFLKSLRFSQKKLSKNIIKILLIRKTESNDKFSLLSR